MIGVVVPAHNEQDFLDACLTSLARAAQHPELNGEPVRALVVLDTCTDASLEIAQGRGFETLTMTGRNVGRARALGADCLLAAGARWLAFTDADSVVAADWLVAQLALRADAVCGTVSLSDTASLPALARQWYRSQYADVDGHRHIHGANIGVSARAYRQAHGFRPLRAHEDMRLVEALERTGARIAWSAAPRVATSPRTNSRAPEGFGVDMRRLLQTPHVL